MINLDIKHLLGRLNAYSKRALEAGAGLCVSRTNYEVTVDHLLIMMVEDNERDFQQILRHYGIEPGRVKRSLQRGLEEMRTGNAGRPVFSPMLIEWFGDAWLLASIEMGLGQVRSGVLIAALLANPSRYSNIGCWDELRQIPGDELKRKLLEICAPSKEETIGLGESKPAGEGGGTAAGGGAAPGGEDSALGRFCVNYTEQARKGKIDPVFARDREIQQMVDILGRRRKNNPICVGEPGVGKTAVVEGLAVKIIEGDVPDFLKGVELLGLDMGLLQAGAGVKGEFENRLKGVIEEVKGSAKPIILFIDEAHTLIGAGGAAGGGDAANLLKPALARGELRTVAATTWTEYKKYFEKDPALARRFQLVKLDEPSPDDAVTIIRGLRGMYEKAHGVYIRDDAVQAAAKMSARFISGRQLPDKAVDVLDTACARVKLSLSSKPTSIDDKERRIATLERELGALKRDVATIHSAEQQERIGEIGTEIEKIKGDLIELNAKWEREKVLVAEILETRGKLSASDVPPAPGQEPAPPLDDATRAELQATLKAKRDELAGVQGKSPLIFYEVTPEAVGRVISDWTGIPVGSMVRDEAKSVLELAENLKKRIKGQDQAITAIDEGVRAAKAGLNNPQTPLGVFLFVGTSGVGKTETATAVADLLFGGERFMCTINMSEFQEKHTVSKLVGSPPGYVGYGEGGLLTEAVRQRPYSVVLLDEVEKADLEVMNVFYQVFDKGTLSDGEGRIIDFKNTIIFLTSNLATDIITHLGTQDPKPTPAELAEAIRPTLSKHFKPALLARMQIVPFFPLLGEALAGIVRLKLDKVIKRLWTSQRIRASYTDAVVKAIGDRCTEVETGARNIDHIINKSLLPQIATEILSRMGDDHQPDTLVIDIGPDGSFVYNFSSSGAPAPAIEEVEEAAE